MAAPKNKSINPTSPRSMPLTAANQEAIGMRLASLQKGKGTGWVLTIEKVAAFAQRAEAELVKAGLPHGERAGAEFHYCPGGTGDRINRRNGLWGTEIRLRRNRTGWSLIHVARIKIHYKSELDWQISITEAQRNKLLRRFRVLPASVQHVPLRVPMPGTHPQVARMSRDQWLLCLTSMLNQLRQAGVPEDALRLGWQ